MGYTYIKYKKVNGKESYIIEEFLDYDWGVFWNSLVQNGGGKWKYYLLWFEYISKHQYENMNSKLIITPVQTV